MFAYEIEKGAGMPHVGNPRGKERVMYNGRSYFSMMKLNRYSLREPS